MNKIWAVIIGVLIIGWAFYSAIYAGNEPCNQFTNTPLTQVPLRCLK